LRWPACASSAVSAISTLRALATRCWAPSAMASTASAPASASAD
jgi:hypothetical protein